MAGFVSSVHAQNGDHAGETQPPLREEWKRPPSPPLSAEEQLERFVVAPGFRVELVAAEPLIEDPVAMAWDERGRLWVVEMRSYMNDIDGSDEEQPISRIVILEDDDGDGRMDRATPFLEGLILPRAIALTHDGVLFVEPPNLIHARDLDGDGRADRTRVLAAGFGGIENPEHAGNGLVWSIDGWFETSQHPTRIRFDGERVSMARVRPTGQWGVAHDEMGRAFYSPNSEPLLVDHFPRTVAARNRAQSRFTATPAAIVSDKRVHPATLTPGVNRGYQDGVLSNGRLARFTGACAPLVYRDDVLGADVANDAFVCEVAGNLVKRFDLSEDGWRVRATPVDEAGEFLASTDERFRPVALSLGPDGAIYVADMYRGIIQHRIYMTSFLRAQVEERGLDKPAALGRIWRVVPDDGALRDPVRLDGASVAELVDALLHRNATTRDIAQRLLVERGADEAAPAIRAMLDGGASGATAPRDRLRAVWTLELLDALTVTDVDAALADPDPHVRRAGLRVMTARLDADEALPRAQASIDDEDEGVRAQAIIALGEIDDSRALGLMIESHARVGSNGLLRDAVLAGLAGREMEILALAGSGALALEEDSERSMLALAADSILDGDDRAARAALVSFAATRPAGDAARKVVLERLAVRLRLNARSPATLRLASMPAGWSEALTDAAADEAMADELVSLRAIDERLLWPSREADRRPARTAVDFADLDAVLARGKRLYVNCMSCHQANGRGLPPIYPPLDGSEWVLGDVSTFAKILIHGLDGPIEVKGELYRQQMPIAPIASDDDLAAVMTWVRQAWSNDASIVTPEEVSAVRAATRDRRGAYTAEALLAEELAATDSTGPGGDAESDVDATP